MSYTPTEWHDGDTITAEAMNNIEQGIADVGKYTANIVIDYPFSGSYSALLATCAEETHSGETHLRIKKYYDTYHIGDGIHAYVAPLIKSSEDDIYLLFTEGMIYELEAEIEGDIVRSNLLASEWSGSWSSGFYAAFLITGDGAIIFNEL